MSQSLKLHQKEGLQN
ncbi:hypothetical protein LEMLEM_LOCUS17667 [Lemmus lemmus]